MSQMFRALFRVGLSVMILGLIVFATADVYLWHTSGGDVHWFQWAVIDLLVLIYAKLQLNDEESSRRIREVADEYLSRHTDVEVIDTHRAEVENHGGA